MKLSSGIVGLPNVGKSTLFKLLTKKEINIANYPFCTIDPNVGIVSVPDERLDKLARLFDSEKKVPAVIEFYDIAGLVRGANQGEGLGNQFLSHIREVNVIIMLLRCFADSSVIHVENNVDPVRDLEIINAELIFKDLETIDKRLYSVEKEIKSNTRGAQKEKETLEGAKGKLLKGELLTSLAEEPAVSQLQLLTAKKQIYFLNGKKEEVSQELVGKIKSLGFDYVVGDLSVEPSIAELILKTYATLGLISFFTAAQQESRAWTIKSGAKAPSAGGAIHSDFEEKFIKAEVINFQELINAGSWQAARNKGEARLEGKDYIVLDGDVMIFRHG